MVCHLIRFTSMLLTNMEAVFAKIAEETTNFGLGDEEVCMSFSFQFGHLHPSKKCLRDYSVLRYVF
jgi:hypothetical protein